MKRYFIKYQVLDDPSFPDFFDDTVDGQDENAAVEAIRKRHEGSEIRVAIVRNIAPTEKPKSSRKKIAIQISIVLLMGLVMASRYFS